MLRAQSIDFYRHTVRSLQGSIRFLLFVTGASGFFLGAWTRPVWQVAVESAQVLAGVVSYPPHNSFHIYHVKLWTILNQLLALPLALGSDERTLSILVSGGVAALSFAAIGLCTFAVSRNAFWGIAAPFMVHFSSVRDVLAVNYPIDFMGTPHTYGAIGLAWSIATVSLIVLERPLAGLFLGLAPAVHPSLGVWCWLITGAALLWHGRGALSIVRKLWRSTVAGLAISSASFVLQWIWMAPVVPRVDASVQAGFLNTWVAFFDFHRRPVDFNFPGVQFTLAAVVIGLYLIPFFAEDDGASLILVRMMIAASIFALLGAGVSLLPPSTVPQTLLILMPTRVFLVSNLLFFAALVGFLSRFQSAWVRTAALFVAVALAVGNSRFAVGAVVISGVAFALWKSVSLSGGRLARRSQWIPILTGCVVLLMSLRGIDVQVRTGRDHWNGMTDRTNTPVLTLASRTEGLLAIGTQCCPFTQMRTRRPLLVETMALDQIMYAPESAPDMNTALKAVYGVDLLHPPEILRSAGFAEDLTPIAKPLWEARTAEEWKRLATAFGFTAVLTNPGWTLYLPEVARDSANVLYKIP